MIIFRKKQVYILKILQEKKLRMTLIILNIRLMLKDTKKENIIRLHIYQHCKLTWILPIKNIIIHGVQYTRKYMKLISNKLISSIFWVLILRHGSQIWLILDFLCYMYRIECVIKPVLNGYDSQAHNKML